MVWFRLCVAGSNVARLTLLIFLSPYLDLFQRLPGEPSGSGVNLCWRPQKSSGLFS